MNAERLRIAILSPVWFAVPPTGYGGIEWEEPFGLVMIESMACGTPVVATRHGAVPEVIEDGRSGIVVDHYREIAAALERADKLDPRECRRYVEERFAPERMVGDYLRAYRAAVGA